MSFMNVPSSSALSLTPFLFDLQTNDEFYISHLAAPFSLFLQETQYFEIASFPPASK